MTYKAIPVVRGCKTRKQAGIYCESGIGFGGKPVEHFLIDPPHRIDGEIGRELGVIKPDGTVFALGVKLIERNGVWHVLDVVGQEFYPNVADMVEEIRRFGLSRRLPKTLDFSKLTPDSRILLAHKRAWVDNFDEYANYWVKLEKREYAQTENQYNPCPKPLPEHSFENHPEMCVGVWWQDVEQAVNVTDRIVERRMPSFSYTAATRPPRVTSEYALAIFGSLPLHRIVVIKAQDGSHQESLEKASKARLSVDLEAE